MFADWELIGIPHRLVISDRGLKEGARRVPAPPATMRPCRRPRLAVHDAVAHLKGVLRCDEPAPPLAGCWPAALAAAGRAAPSPAPRRRQRRNRWPMRCAARLGAIANSAPPEPASTPSRPAAYLRWLGAMSTRLQRQAEHHASSSSRRSGTSRRAGLGPRWCSGWCWRSSGFRKYAISSPARAATCR